MKQVLLGVLLGVIVSSVRCFPIPATPAKAHQFDGDERITKALNDQEYWLRRTAEATERIARYCND